MSRLASMTDLETLDKRPTSVIVSIGSVLFDGLRIVDRFKAKIELKSQYPNRTCDPETVAWWARQSDEARKGLQPSEDDKHLSPALIALATFRKSASTHWSNGPDFDEMILRNAYEQLWINSNVEFWQCRCFRTVRNLHNLERIAPTVAHDALADAEAQALTLMQLPEGLVL